MSMAWQFAGSHDTMCFGSGSFRLCKKRGAWLWKMGMEAKMVYITGDAHGNFGDIEKFCRKAKTKKSDVIVILGDAGINYHGEDFPYDGGDKMLKGKLGELPVTLFCVHGNHEMRPYLIPSYKEIPWYSGGVYIGVVYKEFAYPNLIFAKCGEVYNLGGYRCIVIGGAFSVVSLKKFRDEQPTDEIKSRVEKSLERHDWNIDIVFSHTCPYSHIPRERFLPGIKQWTVDNGTEKWLDGIERKLAYTRWYCGHFHTDKADGKIRFVFTDILEVTKNPD